MLGLRYIPAACSGSDTAHRGAREGGGEETEENRGSHTCTENDEAT